MSKQEALIIASRTLAVLLTVWALSDVSHMPVYIQSYLHYAYYEATSSTNVKYVQYMQHSYLLSLCFLVARIVGYSLLARWLFKGGSEVGELLLPSPVGGEAIPQEQSQLIR